MITVEEEYEELNELLFEREKTHGDSDVIMIAGLLSGHTGEIYRSYVFEKLHAVHSPTKAWVHGGEDTMEDYLDPNTLPNFDITGYKIMCPECNRPQVEHKAGMLDAFGMRRVRRALEEHPDDPIMFLAKISKNAWG